MHEILIENLDKIIEQKKESYQEDIMKFKEIGHQFLNGEITSAQFKATSGGMGVYAQRGGKEFMIRLRILSGVLDLETLKLVKDFTREYSLQFVHLTTRQTIQLHNLQFDDIIHIMEKSQEHNLFTKGGGGNFPRNISLSPLSGVEKEEAFDVTPYAILINKYFLSRMNTYRLPRKFKVAFSNNFEDTANATIADLGFLAVTEEGRNYFRGYLGGGLGANANIAVPFGDRIKSEEVLYHVEAALSLFVEEGDFENKGKARMRYILRRMGQEDFLQCYREHLDRVKKEMKLDFAITEELEAEKDKKFTKTSSEIITEPIRLSSSCVIEQKQDGFYTVVIHPQGGMLRTEDYNNIVTFLEQVPKARVRLSMEESMYIRNLTEVQVQELMEITKDLRKTTRLSRSICCIGVPICQIGIQESQLLLMNILDYFEERGLTEDVLPSLSISGCVNSCGRHQVNQIGLQGKKKRVGDATEDAYTLFIGGKTSEVNSQLALEYGDLLASTIPSFLYELAMQLKEKGIEFDDYLIRHPEEFNTIVKQYQV
ncbi:MAG: nitrite/sulfite reductase [Herbinix sp.]|jgi:ferredoxin-nitrite reductase|nr:nitrite/sulfite reductase [Herbinix sp.]